MSSGAGVSPGPSLSTITGAAGLAAEVAKRTNGMSIRLLSGRLRFSGTVRTPHSASTGAPSGRSNENGAISTDGGGSGTVGAGLPWPPEPLPQAESASASMLVSRTLRRYHMRL